MISHAEALGAVHGRHEAGPPGGADLVLRAHHPFAGPRPAPLVELHVRDIPAIRLRGAVEGQDLLEPGGERSREGDSHGGTPFHTHTPMTSRGSHL